jgi:two-component system sensor histidine kinase and response regulator WspE
LIDLFHAELETHSLALEKGLASVEGSPARDRVEPLARAAHSLRGAARIVGLDRAARLAQAMEELLSAVQNGTRRLCAADLDHLRTANDLFRRLAACSASEIQENLEARSSDIEELVKQLLSPPSEVAKPDATVETAAKPAAPVALDLFLLDLFRTELETHSRALEEGLVEAEARHDPAKLQGLMRRGAPGPRHGGRAFGGATW